MKKRSILIILSGVLLGMGIAFATGLIDGLSGKMISRHALVRRYLQDPSLYPDQTIKAGDYCNGSPFQYPTSGIIGYVWNDSFRPGHHHSGLDIFGPDAPGETAVVAAHDGYLTRLADWKSTVIIRIPADPIQPDRQIWLYYTHMADADGQSWIEPAFPPGTQEMFVRAGTLLGYQGNYSGEKGNPVGMHLHFSIVKSDRKGDFLNETKIENTLDPSLYFGMALTNKTSNGTVPVCP